MARLKSSKFLLIAICLIVVLFYGFITNLYFAQDDFFHLRVGQTDGSAKEFLNLFSFKPFSERGGIYFYRPIFREGLFNVFYRTSGLNPLPFRLAQLLIHLMNTVLVYKLVRLLAKKENVALVSSLVFGISSANVGVLSYLAGGIQASGMTMFLLLSMLQFSKDRRLLAFLFFVLGLASHELAVAYPFVLGGLVTVRHKLNKKNITQFAEDLFPYLVTIGVFLYLQVKVIGLPVSEQQYGFNLSLSRILNSYVWYFVWSLGIPEMLLDFVGPGLKLNPNLMNFWGNYFRVIFPLFLTITLITIITIIKNKLFWFLVFWFIAGISPVVLLPLHRSTYYLAFSLPAVGGLIGLAFAQLSRKKRFLSYLLVISYLVLSLTTIKLSQKTFWAITRAKIAKNLISDVKSKYPSLPKGSTINFVNDPDYPVINKDWGGSSKQAKVALSGNDALRLVYLDPTLIVFYEDDGFTPKEEHFFKITAKIRI